MTQPLRLFSEPFAATGNMHGKGFQRLLGRPALSLVQTVIREALQNCVDAASDSTPTDVLLRIRTLSRREHENLRDLVFRDLPPSEGSHSALIQALRKPRLRVFEICDFNTVGLAGPTRADLASDENESQNFVNFLRNVGASRDVHHGGGTYGYGKTSLYALSSCATILTDSLTTWNGRIVRRVMGCHLGESFSAPDDTGTHRRFTGRHWWGGTFSEQNLEPAEGRHAEEIAEALGLPPRPASLTGTTIMIVDPMFESDENDDIADELVEAVLWNFWPRMVDSTPADRLLKVGLTIDGREVPVPRPEEFPPLDLYAVALERQRRGEDRTEIWCGRPRKLLGHLVIRTGATGRRVGAAARPDSPIPAQSSHIALMRPVELVVKYLPGDAFADARFEWAGVFICSDDDEVEAAFAEAEPPAHDDWIPSNLPKGDPRTFVNVALRRLTERAKLASQPTGVSTAPAGTGPSLAATATTMGKLLTGSSSRGPGRSSTPPRRKTSRKAGVAVERPRFCGLELGPEKQPIAIFEAELHNDGSHPDLRVAAEPHLVADGGRADTDDLPQEYEVRLIKLELPSASLQSSGSELEVGHHSGTLRISVRTPSNAAASVRLTLRWNDGR